MEEIVALCDDAFMRNLQPEEIGKWLRANGRGKFCRVNYMRRYVFVRYAAAERIDPSAVASFSCELTVLDRNYAPLYAVKHRFLTDLTTPDVEKFMQPVLSATKTLEDQYHYQACRRLVYKVLQATTAYLRRLQDTGRVPFFTPKYLLDFGKTLQTIRDRILDPAGRGIDVCGFRIGSRKPYLADSAESMNVSKKRAGRNMITSDRIVQQYVTEVQRTTTVESVRGDRPCFQVLNSNTRNVAGYAHIQVGGTPPGGFKGKFFAEDRFTDLADALALHVNKLRQAGVRGVLLSGTLWSAGCRYSGDVLNSTLPKVFDGMSVKVIASSVYSDALAEDVLHENCDFPVPSNAVYIEADDIICETDYAKDEVNCVEAPVFTSEYTAEPDLAVLESTYGLAFPQDSFVDQEHKMINFHMTPFDEPMPEIALFAPMEAFIDPRALEPGEYMQPALHTHMDLKHPINQQELVHCVYNRNYNPPKEEHMLNSIDNAWQLFESFIDCFYVAPESVSMTANDCAEYISKKGMDFAKQLRVALHEMPVDLQQWQALVKGNPKPTLEDGLAANVQPTQVIICKEKMYNARFGPACTYMKNSLYKYLRPEYFIFSEDDVTGFEKRLNASRSMMRGVCREIDISKYDKSQGWTSLFFELFVFAWLGMDPQMLLDWLVSHVVARVKSITGPTRFVLPPQRRSGDPWTYYGNTFFLMAVLKTVLSEFSTRAIYFMMVSGDDSLVWGDFDNESSTRACETLQRLYNLEAKLINLESLYFCSRFLVDVCGYLKLVPDPVKTLIKFGKTDVRDRGHVEDVRISLLDHIDCYQYPEVRYATAEELQDRYNVICIETAMEHMYAYAQSRTAFASLFRELDSNERCAILVAAGVDLPPLRTYVQHIDLVKKRVDRMGPLELGAYMRNVGRNSGKRILVTYDGDFIPQGYKIVGDMRERFDEQEFKNLLKSHYKG